MLLFLMSFGGFYFSFYQLNEMKLVFKSRKPKRLMGLKTHQGGFKPTISLAWWSVGAFVR